MYLTARPTESETELDEHHLGSLCHACTRIFDETKLESFEAFEWMPQPFQEQPHHTSAEAIRQAAHDGCYVCSRTLNRNPEMITGTVYELMPIQGRGPRSEAAFLRLVLRVPQQYRFDHPSAHRWRTKTTRSGEERPVPLSFLVAAPSPSDARAMALRETSLADKSTSSINTLLLAQY